MALRCSLLGHDYGETEVDREREERGSEVVVTVQEYEECDRCGDRNVISENTEVTSLSAGTDADLRPDEPELESTTDGDADAVESAADAADGEPDADTDEDAEFIDADEAAPATAAAADTDDEEFDVPTDENGDPVTDDGEILEDDDEDPKPDRDRDHGEWPDSDDVGPPVGSENEPTDWPDDDAPADAPTDDPVDDDPDPATDDAVVLEDDSNPIGNSGESPAAADARSVTADPSTTTEPAASGSEPARTGSTDGTGAGSGIERATSATPPGQGDGPRDDVPTEFYCPRCEYVAAGDRGSLRAGDICPECRKGYLGERERR
ncbi:DUF7093 family protein [Haloterrigena alkaliphila]|uniref:Uncharacterized protein n=1 Tax=Haloterrigena alkaliphila TaxID=2816475 RepID=A0A8A2VQG1_9EURY|nr:hypothetical protein [Haloterrigena alkaliphila]QSX00339.1 hypothetical protein J0X25_05070 [Haloterrigena alkaliphila]